MSVTVAAVSVKELHTHYILYKFRSKAKVNVDTMVTDIPAWPTHRLGSSMWHR